MMPYFCAVAGLSSTLSLTILTLLPSVPPEISSSTGAIILQGPHHSAQKSTTTGPLALSTSDSNVSSETLATAMVNPRHGCAVCERRRDAGTGAEPMDGLAERQGKFTAA